MNSHINVLPNDVLRQIFGMLDGHNRATICAVNKHWNTQSCITTLDLLSCLQRGFTHWDIYKDYHLFVIFKPDDTRSTAITYACSTYVDFEGVNCNMEIFKHVYDKNVEPKIAWYAAIGKTDNYHILYTFIKDHDGLLRSDCEYLETAAEEAVIHGHVWLVEECMRQAEDFDYDTTLFMSNIYDACCINGTVETLQELERVVEDIGLDVGSFQIGGLTLACKYGNISIIKYLAPNETLDSLIRYMQDYMRYIGDIYFDGMAEVTYAAALPYIQK